MGWRGFSFRAVRAQAAECVSAPRGAQSRDDQTIRQLDWAAIADDLDAQGWALLPGLLDAAECDGTAALYGPSDAFRSHVVMARHGFGRGEYRYFAYPLPPLVQAAARRTLSPPRADREPLARTDGARRRGFPTITPRFWRGATPAARRGRRRCCCNMAPGDYNCLHQDLYGEHVFPLQVAVLLSAPGADFDGGEFVLTEQRPRMQSRVEVVPLGKGDGVVFAVNSRPQRGGRGDYRVAMRHGVSRVRRGQRHTLGIIFHDAA